MPLPRRLPGPSAAGARRRRGHAPDVVRRHLPGSAELLRATSRSSRSAFLEIYPEFILPPDQVKAWLADRQGAIVGEGARRAVRLEDRRSRSAARAPSTSRSRAVPGSSTSPASTTAADGVDKTQFFFRYDYLDREPRSSARDRSAGTSSRSPTRRGGGVEPDVRRACSPTRPPRRRRRPRRGSSRASRSRSATSARS